MWNATPQALRNLSKYVFKRKLKQILFNTNPFICSSFSWLKNLWRKKCSRSKVAASGEISLNLEDYLETERCKEELGDFTLSEYNEKGIKRLVLFALNHTTFAIITNRLETSSLAWFTLVT